MQRLWTKEKKQVSEYIGDEISNGICDRVSVFSEFDWMFPESFRPYSSCRFLRRCLSQSGPTGPQPVLNKQINVFLLKLLSCLSAPASSAVSVISLNSGIDYGLPIHALSKPSHRTTLMMTCDFINCLKWSNVVIRYCIHTTFFGVDKVPPLLITEILFVVYYFSGARWFSFRAYVCAVLQIIIVGL